jgi:outer membrane immunogenic protein
MQKFIAGFAAVAALSIAGAAHAQSSASPFDGPSVGVQGGWERTGVHNPSTDLGVAPIKDHKNTGVVGGFVGYDKQVASHIVIGGQAELNLPIDSSFNRNGVQIDPKRSIDLSVRAGYLVTPATLVYVRGGYANERVGTRIVANGVTLSGSEGRDGWLVGGGVERMITDKISTRLEYRYSDFSGGDGKFDRHQVLLGVAYRF